MELSFFTCDAIKSNAEGLTTEEIADVEKAYQAACNYMRDQQLEFINELREKGHFDPEKDLLCLTTDHGEAFNPGKHDLMGHASFFEEIVRVPLIINHPHWDEQTIDEQVSLIDVMPTVLAAADLAVPGTFEGRSCSTPSELAQEYVYAIDGNPVRRMIRGDGKKLFAHWLGGDEFEVVCTTYETGKHVNEKIVFRCTLAERNNSRFDSLPAGFGEIHKQITDEHGELLEQP